MALKIKTLGKRGKLVKKNRAGSFGRFNLKSDPLHGGEIKRALAASLSTQLRRENLSITAFAKRMGTGRTAVRRILDGQNTGITLETMSKAASALGLRLTLQTEPLCPSELDKLASKLVIASTMEEATAITDQIVEGFYPRTPLLDSRGQANEAINSSSGA